MKTEYGALHFINAPYKIGDRITVIRNRISPISAIALIPVKEAQDNGF
jgi:hypothetical protein